MMSSRLVTKTVEFLKIMLRPLDAQCSQNFVVPTLLHNVTLG